MACSITLFDYLGGTPNTGGTWTLQSGGPSTISVNGGAPTTIANNNQVGTTHSVTIDVSGTAASVLVFRYTAGVGTCSTTADVTVTVVNGAIAGVGVDITVCSDDPTVYNLMDMLAGGSGTGTNTGAITQTGTWSGSGTGAAFTSVNAYVPGGTAPSDDTFAPANVNLGGNTTVQAQFIYTVSNADGTTPPSCDNCNDTATILFTVTAAGDAGQDGAVTLCNNPA